MNKLTSRRIGTEIELGPKIGNDGFSKIRIGYKNGKEYAVKYTKYSILTEFKDLSTQFFTEVTTLSNLDNLHIMKIHGYSSMATYTKQYSDIIIETTVSYYIFDKPLQWSLMDIIYFSQSLSENTARFYFKQLLSTITYLHTSGYTHRNLKLKYLLLDNNCNLLLSGFSHACTSKEQVNIKPKEPIQGHDLSTDDIFSLGYILFIMLFKHPPFIRSLPSDMLYKFICEYRIEDFWKQFTKIKVSNEAKNLISRLIAYEEIFRPTLCEIEYMPWVQGQVSSIDEVQKEITELIQITGQRAREEAVKRKKRKLQNSIDGAIVGFNGYAGNTRGIENSLLTEVLIVPKRIPDSNLLLGGAYIYTMEHPIEIQRGLMSYLVLTATSYKIDSTKFKVSIVNKIDGSNV